MLCDAGGLARLLLLKRRAVRGGSGEGLEMEDFGSLVAVVDSVNRVRFRDEDLKPFEVFYEGLKSLITNDPTQACIRNCRPVYPGVLSTRLERGAHDAAVDPQRGAVRRRRKAARHERDEGGDFRRGREASQERRGTHRPEELPLYFIHPDTALLCERLDEVGVALRPRLVGRVVGIAAASPP